MKVSLKSRERDIVHETPIARNRTPRRWRGKEIALKSFGMLKMAREREARAYERLKEIWGELVLKPDFISDMYGMAALL